MIKVNSYIIVDSDDEEENEIKGVMAENIDLYKEALQYFGSGKFINLLQTDLNFFFEELMQVQL